MTKGTKEVEKGVVESIFLAGHHIPSIIGLNDWQRTKMFSNVASGHAGRNISHGSENTMKHDLTAVDSISGNIAIHLTEHKLTP